ncbi:hypothetical protein CSC74_03190 [Pseudoxanthomonas yeongjuensis]|nr:hypothetical protein CSC74_03190 [Pseudoxanthomonas yeongjuensis]
MRDAEGNLLVSYRQDQLAYTATTVMGGVRKMFILFEDVNGHCDCSVAAVTSGLATMDGITIAEHANRYRLQLDRDKVVFSEVVSLANHFLAHMRGLWEADYVRQGFSHPSQAALRFMVAGYCRDDARFKVFRVSVEENICIDQLSEEPYTGAAWDGQSNFAARLIMGVDPGLQDQVSRGIVEALKAQRDSLLDSFTKAIVAAGIQDLELDLDESVPAAPPWSSAIAPIDWGNMPIQTAIELVSALVNTESGMQKFVQGIPVVGGRTRIGLLRRNVPFAMLNEPALSHIHTGYLTDA